MTQPSRTLFHRIRCIKSSLDKAEQSFMDNKDIRGELDLMLAEAELKNLRRKKDRPWTWNRQVLAVCAAFLLVAAGFGGWCFARNHYRVKAQAALPPAAAPVVKPQQAMPVQAAPARTVPQQKQSVNDVPAQEHKENPDRVTISKADMHKLVQSARVELSNSK